MPVRGRMLVMDGVDGAGKGVQCAALAAALERGGIHVLRTREPGGSPSAEAVRQLIVEGETGRWDSMSELLLMYAARRAHLVQTIWPALEAGSWVVCDRFADSSRTFQGVAGGLGIEVVDTVHRMVVGSFEPDLTIILDVPVEVGLARAHARGGGADRFERKGVAYHERVRAAFIELARRDPERHVLLDATAPAADVTREVLAVVSRMLGLPALAAP